MSQAVSYALFAPGLPNRYGKFPGPSASLPPSKILERAAAHRPQIGNDPEQNLVSPDVRMALEEEVANPFSPLPVNATEALS
jgi:hypothetical protein